jgi:hypothetical protein
MLRPTWGEYDDILHVKYTGWPLQADQDYVNSALKHCRRNKKPERETKEEEESLVKREFSYTSTFGLSGIVAELDVRWHGLVTSEADQMTAPE